MKTKDPRTLHKRPPYSSKTQKPPGKEAEMKPTADHGAESYEGTGRLEGHTALITGADSGIGRAVALASHVRELMLAFLTYRKRKMRARPNACVKDAGCKAVLLPGDIGQPSICEAVARDAIKGLGGVSILVNNAAYQRNYEKLDEISDDEFEEAYRVNVFAMFRLCKAILPQMKEGGSIINTASIQSFDPTSGLIVYASTKAAIASFTRSLAGLAMKQGVRVNAVAPGPVWTPLIPSTLPAERAKNFGADTLFGRAAQPAEMAPIFVFLASAEASYVTGEIYGATGGQMPI